MPYRRIVVALLGAIGDVILSTPLLEGLRLRFPDSRITFLVGETSAPVLQNLSLIDELIILPEGEHFNRWKDLRETAKVVTTRFDLALCLTRSNKLAVAFWLGRIPTRLCYEPLRLSWLFTHRIDSEAAPQNGAHRTGYFLAALTRLGIPLPPRIRLHYRITNEERDQARLMLKDAGLDPNRETIVAIHPGTSEVLIEKRRWAAANFVEVAKYILRRDSRKVVLLGGPAERLLAKEFHEIQSKSLIDLTGRLDIRALAAVLEQCTLLVHNDSSPLHLAGAVGTPVVAIFGYQNPLLWGPLGPLDSVVRRDLPCSPCLPEFPCARDFECIRKLEPETVIAKLETVLESLEMHRERA